MNRSEVRTQQFAIKDRNKIITQASALWKTTQSSRIVLSFLRRQGFDQSDSLACLVRDSSLSAKDAKNVLAESRVWTDEFWYDENARKELYEAAETTGFQITQEIGLS